MDEDESRGGGGGTLTCSNSFVYAGEFSADVSEVDGRRDSTRLLRSSISVSWRVAVSLASCSSCSSWGGGGGTEEKGEVQRGRK